MGKPGPAGKTCLTCRRRHKACDQARPTCERCKKSGFTCLGYDSSQADAQSNRSIASLENPEYLRTTRMLAAETSTKSADSAAPAMSNLSSSQLSLLTCSSTPQVIPLSYRFINTTSPPPDTPHSPLTPTLRISPNKQDSSMPSALPPTVSLLPPSVRKLLDNFMLRYQRLTDMSFFGPAKWQIARTREVFSQRLQTSATSLWSMSLLTKIVDAMFDGVRPSETSFDMFRRWFKLHETWATSSHSLTLGEPQGRLSGNLEVALFALRVTNTISPYECLTNYAPTFLQIIRSNIAFRTTSHNSFAISIACVLTSRQYELVHFILLDLLCSMAYGLPQVVEYDTSVIPPESNMYPTEWVHGCPIRLKIMLANLNKHVTWSRAGITTDWQSLERELLSWQPPNYIIPDEEAWKKVARLAVQESWRHTLLIYLYMGVCGFASDDVRVSSSVRQVFQIHDTVKHHLQLISRCSFLTQYLIAGACTPNEKQRALARESISYSVETILWLFPLSNFVPVLDHLWHGAAAGGRPIRWSDYLHSRRTMLPVFSHDDGPFFYY